MNSHKIPPNSSPPAFTSDFGAMIAVFIWTSTGFYFFDFVIPYVSAQILHISGTELGIVFSVITIGVMVSSPISGWVTDHLPKRWFVVGGTIGRGISYLIIYVSIIARSYWGFMFGCFFLGLAVSFVWVPLNAIIAQKSCPERRSEAYSKRDLAVGIGTLIGGLIGFSIFSIFSEYAPENFALIYISLILFAGANFYGAWLFSRKIRDEITYDNCVPNLSFERNRDPSTSSVIPAWKLRRLLFLGVLLLLVAVFVSATNERIAKPFIQFYLFDYLTSDPQIVMLVYLPTGVISLLITPLLGKWADQINPKYGLVIVATLGAITTWALISTRSVVLFAILLVFDAAFATAAALILDNFFSRISKKNRGKLLGLRTFIGQIGGIIGPILGGYLWDHLSHRSPFQLSIFVELLLIPLIVAAVSILIPMLDEKTANSGNLETF
jgi:MFS family permease